jgi:rhodanese-related sulfurtransferase
MPTDIDRGQVRELLDRGAQLVEVLPGKHYEREHLPNAISLPLSELDRETRLVIHPDRPVVVYCYDTQ